MVSFLLLYTLCWSLYLIQYLTLVSFTLLFLPTPIPYNGHFLIPLYLVLVSLPTLIPCNGSFQTPLPGAGLFTYSNTLQWFLSNSCTWCWSFYLILYLVLVSFVLLYHTLISILLLYLVLVFLPPYTGLFHPPVPCTGLFTHSYTLHWSISHFST